MQVLDKSGERGRNRTYNLLIKSQLLCQLSYAPAGGDIWLERQTEIITSGWGLRGHQTRNQQDVQVRDSRHSSLSATRNARGRCYSSIFPARRNASSPVGRVSRYER